MTITEHPRLTPESNGAALVTVEQRHNTSLVKHISPLANIGVLHLVEWLVEEFLVLSDEELSNGGQLALTLCDGVNLDALNEHLDERSRLRELSPSERQALEANVELLL